MTAVSPESLDWEEESRDPSTVEPGAQALGRYRLCYELASGGMATVFLARMHGPGGYEKLVALKRIHPHLAKQRAFVSMFLDEARIASQISHPNVCTVFDFGEVDGTYYLAMEYLVGEPLWKVARAIGRSGGRDERTPVLAARIVADACEGLHAAHELTDSRGDPLNVVHRDVSPHNLFVTYDGGVRVVDFGIASAENRLHHTRTGTVKGKFAYMAPEQHRAERVDRRADVWGLGVVAWELMTGQRLFRRDNDSETIQAVMAATIPPPSLVAEVPSELDDIVLRALARDPAERFPDARSMGRELTQVLGTHPPVVGLGDLAEWMDALFPDGRAGKRALTDLAEKLPDQIEDGGRSRVRARGWPVDRYVAIGLALLLIAGGAFVIGGLTGSAEPDAAQESGSAASEAEPERLPDLAEPEPAPAPTEPEREPEVADGVPVEPMAVEEPTATPSAMMRRAERGRGEVNVVTPGGWAEVWVRGRRRGQTPVQFALPAGRHVIVLKPNGRDPERRRRVTVRLGRVSRVVVPLR